MDGKYSKLCEINNQRMEKFLDVSLLLLLYKGPGHGYGLIDQLKHLGFIEDNLNVGTLYRNLRRLEKDTLVVSSWVHGDQGPKRRVYSITENGRIELDNWVLILKLRKERINTIIESYEKILDLRK